PGPDGSPGVAGAARRVRDPPGVVRARAHPRVVLVHPPVAVVVAPVADLREARGGERITVVAVVGAARHRDARVRDADLGRRAVPVLVLVGVLAGDAAAVGLAHHPAVGRADVLARAPVRRAAARALPEVLVDAADAVVVEAVADLGGARVDAGLGVVAIRPGRRRHEPVLVRVRRLQEQLQREGLAARDGDHPDLARHLGAVAGLLVRLGGEAHLVAPPGLPPDAHRQVAVARPRRHGHRLGRRQVGVGAVGRLHLHACRLEPRVVEGELDQRRIATGGERGQEAAGQQSTGPGAHCGPERTSPEALGRLFATGEHPGGGDCPVARQCIPPGGVTYERSGDPRAAAARALFEEVRDELLGAPAAPLSTYRLQLNRDLPFPKAAEVVPYLSRLGASHLYASPTLAAAPGSLHGYDVVDHQSLNPEF